MYIVDAQVHIWGADTPQRPWPAAHIEPHRPTPFSMDDLLREMDAAGVYRAVIVPPMWEGDRDDLGLEAARLHPDRFSVMGRIDVQTPASRSLITTWTLREKSSTWMVVCADMRTESSPDALVSELMTQYARIRAKE